MPCKTCGTGQDLEVCLYCGHSFCTMHRAQSGGVPACTGCLKAERDRKAGGGRTGREAPRNPARTRDAVEVGQGVKVEERRLPPLPEPKGFKPLLVAVAAAGPTGLYLFWLCGRLVTRHELPGWFRLAGTIAGAAFVFLGVWAIAKSKL